MRGVDHGGREIDALLQRDPEARHALVGDRQMIGLLLDQPAEERNDAATRADHVAVAQHGEARADRARQVVGRHEDLVGSELARAVEIDRVAGLVRGKGEHVLHAVAQRGMNHVLGAVDVGVQALERVVFGGGHMLHRGRVHDAVDFAHRHLEAVRVANVADEVADRRIVMQVEALLHFVLLELVARVHDHASRLGPLQYVLDEQVAERTGPARDQHGFVIEERIRLVVNDPHPKPLVYWKDGLCAPGLYYTTSTAAYSSISLRRLPRSPCGRPSVD